MKKVPLRDPVVVYRFGLETNVPAVSQKDLWMADLSAKLLLGLSGDNWKSSEADSKSLCRAQRLGSYSQTNPDMHSERMDISTCTQLLAGREHLISLEIIKYINRYRARAFRFSPRSARMSNSGAAQESRVASTREVVTDRVRDKNEKKYSQLREISQTRAGVIVTEIEMFFMSITHHTRFDFDFNGREQLFSAVAPSGSPSTITRALTQAH